MRFQLTFTESAERAMAELSPDLLAFLEMHLNEFALAPRACGARPTPSPPFVPGGMIVHCKRDFISKDLPACHFTVHFLYHSNETDIIVNVAAQTVEPYDA